MYVKCLHWKKTFCRSFHELKAVRVNEKVDVALVGHQLLIIATSFATYV